MGHSERRAVRGRRERGRHTVNQLRLALRTAQDSSRDATLPMRAYVRAYEAASGAHPGMGAARIATRGLDTRTAYVRGRVHGQAAAQAAQHATERAAYGAVTPVREAYAAHAQAVRQHALTAAALARKALGL